MLHLNPVITTCIISVIFQAFPGMLLIWICDWLCGYPAQAYLVNFVVPVHTSQGNLNVGWTVTLDHAMSQNTTWTDRGRPIKIATHQGEPSSSAFATVAFIARQVLYSQSIGVCYHRIHCPIGLGTHSPLR